MEERNGGTQRRPELQRRTETVENKILLQVRVMERRGIPQQRSATEERYAAAAST